MFLFGFLLWGFLRKVSGKGRVLGLRRFIWVRDGVDRWFLVWVLRESYRGFLYKLRACNGMFFSSRRSDDIRDFSNIILGGRKRYINDFIRYDFIYRKF